MKAEKRYFFKMIERLRETEEVYLYQNIIKIDDIEKNEVIEFLRDEFLKENLEYPFEIPGFNPEAAVWAAEVVYIAAQLILFRKNKYSELDGIFPEKEFEINPSTILSVDLCFRFLPDLLVQLKMIDIEDGLLEILENKLKNWYYSGIKYSMPLESLEFEVFTEDSCILQLFVNRVIEYRKIELARNPLFYNRIKANLGIFENEFWKEFKLINIDE